jgi:hypothetical protein
MLSDAIEELRAGRVAGVEVASVALPSCSSLLVAGLVPEGEGMVIELGRWPVSPQGVPEPSGAGLRLGTADLPLARRVLSQAEAALPMAVLGEEEIQDLAREGDLAAVVASGPDGQPWFVLTAVERDGLAAVPVADHRALRRVLAEAERELVEAGLMGLSADLAN